MDEYTTSVRSSAFTQLQLVLNFSSNFQLVHSGYFSPVLHLPNSDPPIYSPLRHQYPLYLPSLCGHPLSGIPAAETVLLSVHFNDEQTLWPHYLQYCHHGAGWSFGSPSLLSWCIHSCLGAIRVWGFIFSIWSFNKLQFHTSVWIESYLAVVYPATYLGLKNKTGSKIRNVVISWVWMQLLAWTASTPFWNEMFEIIVFLYVTCSALF